MKGQLHKAVHKRTDVVNERMVTLIFLTYYLFFIKNHLHGF